MSAEFKEIKDDATDAMAKAVESLGKEFAGLRTGRASVGLLENIQVEIYGAMMPINQVASLSVPEARMISVQVWDNTAIKNVEKAIRDSGLGLNPAVDGSLIRIPLPPLSEERRLELIKIAGKYTETARISVRNARRDALDTVKKLEKESSVSEDAVERFEKEIQTMTDDSIKELDELLKLKEADIKQV